MRSVPLSGLIRALVVLAVLAVLPRPAVAQGLDAAPVAALPAPRLAFSEAEMRLAERVAAHPGLADFYGSNGLKPVFLGAGGRRAAPR